MNTYNTIIIGGGASGLFLAKNLAENNINTLVIEKMDSPAKKLLITGGGMCNLTRDNSSFEFLKHYDTANKFLGPSFALLSPQDTQSWFKNRGLDLITREDGKIFPKSRNAKSVLDLLLDSNYTLLNNTKVESIKKEDDFFIVNDLYKATNVVLACGGMSYPSTGSTGDGYDLARKLNHTVIDLKPGLASFKITNEDVSEIEGISLKDVTISFNDMYSNKKKIRKNTDDLIFTRIGISGPVVLDISKYAKHNQKIYLNLNCQIQKESTNKLLSTSIRHQTQLQSRLANYLLKSLNINDDICENISKKKVNQINEKLKRWELEISLKGQLKGAMATSGGINLKEVDNKTLESKIVNNLYFCGEILDFCGDCGGYNLQACWSTAFSVSTSIKNKTK
ncbi:MAG: NAD(P)/FAD-dependent oxidoreductase [Pleomorphochaeta sp.]